MYFDVNEEGVVFVGMRFGDDVVENVVYIVGWCIKKFFCEGVVICCFDVYLIGFFVVR